MVGRLHIPYAAINETSNPHDCLINQHLPASFPSHNPEFSRKITINYFTIMTSINFRLPDTENLKNQGILHYLHENTLPPKNYA